MTADEQVDVVLGEFRRKYLWYRDRGGQAAWPEFRDRCVDLLICVLEAI